MLIFLRYPAALIPRTLFSLVNVVDVYSYWTFSDLFEEHGQYSAVFQEGFGLMTIYGVRKSAWRAFELMGKAGNEYFNATANQDSTVNVFTTLNRNAKELMIFVSNYQVPTQQAETYTVTVKLNTNSTPKNCIVTVIDETHTNPFTKWKQIGSPEYPTQAQLKVLHEASDFYKEPIEPVNNNFVLKVTNPSLNVITCNL